VQSRSCLPDLSNAGPQQSDHRVGDESSVVILCATASARFSSWARVRRLRARLSREPHIKGRRVGRACASCKLAIWPSTSSKLFSHSVSSRVSAVSTLPSIGQKSFVRAMVGFSLGIVSRVLNPRALSLGQSLTKAASPSHRETRSFPSSLVRSLMFFSSSRASILSLNNFNARAQQI